MFRMRLFALLLLLGGLLLGYFAYPFLGIFQALNIPYRLGLDLAGGTHLVYAIGTTNGSSQDRTDALEGLRDVIERRVNLFGVSEPIVQIAGSQGNERLLVELAGVFDINKAIQLIGDTPFLEFRKEEVVVLEQTNEAADTALGETADETAASTSTMPETTILYVPTGLTGEYLERATLQFDQLGKPSISLTFNSNGAQLFETLTEQNVGKSIAIYLDEAPISVPVVREKISGGQAEITGDFTIEEARTLVRRLNSGALPVPIQLVSQQSVQATLGAEALRRSFFAGLVGSILVIVFMIAWYRLPGVLSVLALGTYVSIILALFKLIPVTLSAAAITGFILSVGIAVDANILIFERLKEELLQGKSMHGSIEEGFERAWTSIRDSNVSSLITSLILWWFGTSIIKGFALTLGIGVLVSMFSAIIVTRTFLRAIGNREIPRFLMLSGFHR